jgi:endonuclease YncB( thermonuclease family)
MTHFTKKQYYAAVFFLVTVIPTSCFAWSGKAVAVSDGDTLKVLHHGKVEKIRLYGIYPPPIKQDVGKKARDFVSSFVLGENVEVERKGTGKNARALVSVNGEVINELMVINGHAWVHRQSCKEQFCTDWIKMEDAAKQEKKGLWRDPNIIPPWEQQPPRGK